MGRLDKKITIKVNPDSCFKIDTGEIVLSRLEAEKLYLRLRKIFKPSSHNVEYYNENET